ncbi:unnamed protein product [Larinioides sclopetarius]|uniref:Uncharacterized protein n=1 Tax=Larinioides sclopetarius TaxID=280406 RepID=A0AAV1ZKS9_9ARAC
MGKIAGRLCNKPSQKSPFAFSLEIVRKICKHISVYLVDNAVDLTGCNECDGKPPVVGRAINQQSGVDRTLTTSGKVLVNAEKSPT